MAHVTARAWTANGEAIPREEAIALVASLIWRGIRGVPRAGDASAADHAPRTPRD